MMKGLVVLVLVVMVSAVHSYVPIHPDYHDTIGIPLASKLRRAEEAKDFDGSRIVGGSVAGLGTHPHLAAIVIATTAGWTSFCGASLLSHTRSVTAAHCWRSMYHQARAFTLAFGTTNIWTGGVRVQANSIQLHPNYNAYTLNHDVAMIVHRWVGYTNVIQPIFLPPNHLLNNQFVGWWAWAAGYGSTSDRPHGGYNQIKHQVALLIISNDVCRRTFPHVTPQTLCTSTEGGRSTCFGDSGGPLAFTYGGRRTLVGISSFVADTCEGGHPAGFVRVTSYVSWIRSRM